MAMLKAPSSFKEYFVKSITSNSTGTDNSLKIVVTDSQISGPTPSPEDTKIKIIKIAAIY